MLIQRDRPMLAVSVMLDVAVHGGRSRTVNGAEIVERLGMTRRGLETLLQTLSRAGLLESIRGPNGGYRLGRPRRDIRLSDIVAVVVDDAATTDLATGRLQTDVVEPVWSDLNLAIQQRLAAMTLDDLVLRAAAFGIRPPVAGPLNFAI